MTGECGLGDDVGRIEPAAEANLEEDHITQDSPRTASSAAAVVISNWVMSSPSLTACVRAGHQRVLPRRWGLALPSSPGDLDALMEAHEVRRGVHVHAVSCGLQYGLQVGRDGPLAVGAGDVDDGRQIKCGLPSFAKRRSTRPSERSMSFGCRSLKSARS